MFYIVSYDIPDDKKRDKVATLIHHQKNKRNLVGPAIAGC
jgi:CRISPR/Cas system-associated endoribonuclease Cas2